MRNLQNNRYVFVGDHWPANRTAIGMDKKTIIHGKICIFESFFPEVDDSNWIAKYL